MLFERPEIGRQFGMTGLLSKHDLHPDSPYRGCTRAPAVDFITPVRFVGRRTTTRCQPQGRPRIRARLGGRRIKCKALPAAQLVQWNAQDPGTKCFWRRFGAAQPSPAVHNGACRG
jgi:hypothetical protein